MSILDHRGGGRRPQQDQPAATPSGTPGGRGAAGFGTSVAGGTPARPATHRSWGLIALASLLVVGTGLAVAAWGLRAGDRESVLALGQAVAKGEVVERTDLITRSVSGLPDAVAAEDLSQVVGRTAAADLVAGQILNPSLVTDRVVPGPGEATVGLALDPSRVPGLGLGPGDVVDVVAVPGLDTAADPSSLDAPAVLAAAAEVVGVGGDATVGGQQLVTLIVAAGDAAQVATYSTQSRVALVEVARPSGTATPGAVSTEPAPPQADPVPGPSDVGTPGSGLVGEADAAGKTP